MTEQPSYVGLLDDWPHQQRAIAGVVALLGVPESFIDFGCGSGATVHFMSHHVEDFAIGYERDVGELAGVLGMLLRSGALYLGRAGVVSNWDLRRPMLVPPAELVTCWEVGEHIEEGAVQVFLDNICAAVRPGGWLVFTAAQPGQAGTGHVNCQTKAWWAERLQLRGLEYDAQKTEFLTVIWDHTVNPLLWLRDNVQVWRRPDVD